MLLGIHKLAQITGAGARGARNLILLRQDSYLVALFTEKVRMGQGNLSHGQSETLSDFRVGIGTEACFRKKSLFASSASSYSSYLQYAFYELRRIHQELPSVSVVTQGVFTQNTAVTNTLQAVNDICLSTEAQA